jgi:putative photosynthetic complex assembly protein
MSSTHSDEIHVPRGPLLGIALLIGLTILAVATMRLSGVEVSSRSQAAVVAERTLRFEDGPDGSVRVLDVRPGAGAGETATVLQVIEPGNGGFLRGALRALVRERRGAGLGQETPFRLVAHADGRLTLEDPATSRRVDLESFGPTNAAAFAQLLARPQAGTAQLTAAR